MANIHPLRPYSRSPPRETYETQPVMGQGADSENRALKDEIKRLNSRLDKIDSQYK